MTTANLAAADRRFGSELFAQLLALYDVRCAAIYARGREKNAVKRSDGRFDAGQRAGKRLA